MNDDFLKRGGQDRRPDVEAVAQEAADVLDVALPDVGFHGRRLGDRKALVVEWWNGVAV